MKNVRGEGDEGAGDAALDTAIERATGALLAKQDAQGFWCGELQGDSILESEYILTRFVLDQEGDPRLPLIANYLRSIQQADGGWNLYPGGAADLSATVKGYFALKLMGDDPNAPHMRRAANIVRAFGGAEKCNTFTRFFFAGLGQISYDACPSVPPEVVLLPKWFYFNLYHLSAWTRTMILPIGIVNTFRYRRRKPLTAEQRIDELYLDTAAGNRLSPQPLRGFPKNWREFFLRVDQALKVYERAPLPSLRERAMREAEKWLLEHLEGTEGLGAIFPPMVYLLIVFRCLGYADDHPRVKLAHKHLEDFFIREGDAIRIQPCLSPVWDTGIAMHALAEVAPHGDECHAHVRMGMRGEEHGFASTRGHGTLQNSVTAAEAAPTEIDDAACRASRWLLSKECTFASDWQKNCPGAAPGGWFFEFANPHYPDVDDTAMVAMALKRLGGPAAAPAISRGVNWLLEMQNDDGGWAAFDRTKDRPILEKVPFADHNALQDPSCPDIVGRTLESLGHCGLTVEHPAVRRAITYLKRQQDPSGAWWGRWGVNYVYGTWQVLCGLRSVGEDMNAAYVQRAADWLRSCQKGDGSWGESCYSYEDASTKGVGESTPSQTAWGAMGLLAASGPNDPAVQRAIEWLIDHQTDEGSWEENFCTGTGFPRVFYLTYHLYRLYFPFMALARYRRLLQLI